MDKNLENFSAETQETFVAAKESSFYVLPLEITFINGRYKKIMFNGELIEDRNLISEILALLQIRF